MKIALINFGGIGDEILFLPTIKSLKNAYPNSKITLVLEPRSKCITELTDLIVNTIECDIKNGNKILKALKLIAQLRREKFDMIVSSGSSPVISLILFLSGIKKRYGYDTGFLSRVLLRNTIKLNKQQYAANMYHDLISPVCSEKAQLPELVIKSSAQTNPIQEKIDIPTDKKIILLHPGTSELSRKKNIIKNYDGWAKVIEQIKDEHTVILAGGPDDKEVIKKLDADGIINMYGKTKNIKELAALMKKADLILCVDSAPMHMAVGLGKKLIAIFGPTDEKKLLPNDENFTAITTHTSCRPCLWDKRNESCKQLSCLKIPADKVIAKISETMS